MVSGGGVTWRIIIAVDCQANHDRTGCGVGVDRFTRYLSAGEWVAFPALLHDGAGEIVVGFFQIDVIGDSYLHYGVPFTYTVLCQQQLADVVDGKIIRDVTA